MGAQVWPQTVTPAELAAALVDRPLIYTAILTADFPKTNDTLTAVTGWDKEIVFEAGHWYQVTLSVMWEGGDGIGSRVSFNGGTATATGLNGTGTFAFGSPSFTGSNYQYQVAITSLADVIESGGYGGNLLLIFTIQVDTGGTFNLTYAQFMTDAEASRLKKYSTITAVDVTP